MESLVRLLYCFTFINKPPWHTLQERGKIWLYNIHPPRPPTKIKVQQLLLYGYLRRAGKMKQTDPAL